MEKYQGVPTKEDDDVVEKNGDRRRNRKKYARIFPPYFPQVLAVVTGKHKGIFSGAKVNS